MTDEETIANLRDDVKRLDAGWRKASVDNLVLAAELGRYKKALEFAYQAQNQRRINRIKDILEGNA